nr:agrocinopine synthase [Agrobacterium sp.] [Nicotiana noctiflora]
MYNWGEGVQECTKTSLLTALGNAGKRNLSELDIALTSDSVPTAFHEFNPWRVTLLPDTSVRALHSSQIENATVIIRDVELGKHSQTYTTTKDTVPFIEPLLDKIFETNPNATIFLDGREFEAHIIVAWLSHRPRFHQRDALLFYSFRYSDGEAFVDAVREEGPALNWRKTVAVTPVLFPEELPKLASQIGLGDLNEEHLYQGGRAWINSMLRQEMRTVAVQIMMARVQFSQMSGSEDLTVVRAFNADRAAVRLAYYVKNDPEVRGRHPHLKLSTGIRAYVFSSKLADGHRAYFGIDFKSSRERPWETDQRKYIRRGYATPGNAAEIVDWVISDRLEDDMAI